MTVSQVGPLPAPSKVVYTKEKFQGNIESDIFLQTKLKIAYFCKFPQLTPLIKVLAMVLVNNHKKNQNLPAYTHDSIDTFPTFLNLHRNSEKVLNTNRCSMYNFNFYEF